MNDSVRDEIWVTVPVTRGPRVFVRHVELSELCLLMCPSPPGGQLPAWAQFWVDKVMALTLHFAMPPSVRVTITSTTPTATSHDRGKPTPSPAPVVRQDARQKKKHNHNTYTNRITCL